tara:strand:- start:2053 stop:2889 length:837 start_codon:yes stop_codon:yes gene_type:complete
LDQKLDPYKKIIRWLAIPILLGFTACTSNEEKAYIERSVNTLYNQAVDALEAGDFFEASKYFDEVERQHPYSIWATKGKLLSAYANYEAGKYDDAIMGLDRFIQLHPGNKDTAYAYYLKALSFYEQITDVSRDQLATEKALKALRDVIRRYPRTKYARDARLKVDLTRDHLAGKEMSIGRFYLIKKEYIAAINRFRRVVKQYQTTTHTPEALHRLVEAYTAIGLRNEAKKAASVLGHNYPGSEWYTDSYKLMTGIDIKKTVENKKKKGFLSRTWNRIF